LSVHYSIKGNLFVLKSQGPCLIVSNHLSYLDPLILYAVMPAVFIASKEIEDTPVVGWFPKVAGCIFVERRKRNQLEEEIKKIAQVLEKGLKVVLLPEAASSNGEKVLPFKGALMKSALLAQKNVQPVCLRYDSVNGQEISMANRDSVFWYGDMKFFPHFFKFIQLKRVHVSVEFLDPLVISGETDRKDLAEKAQEKIQSVYTPLARTGT